MLKFNKVVLHNFLSYKDATLDLDNQGVTLIEGQNNSNDAYTSSGSGKSSLLSGITYALYGKTVTGLTSNAVINKDAGTDCFVELYFSVDKDNYVIKRYRKGKKGNSNKVRLFLNENEITEATNPKTDSAIQDLIGIQFNTYVNTISYGSSDEPVFSQATDKGKKEILENLANTGIYAKARDLASDKLKEFKLKVADEENKKVNATNMLNQYHELEKQDKSRYEEEQKRQNANKQDLERLKTERDNYLKESSNRVSELKNSLSELTSKEPKSDGSARLSEAYDKLDKTKQGINKINTRKAQDTTMLNNLREQYKDLQSKEVCPVCNRPLDKEHKAQELQNITSKGQIYKTNITKYDEVLQKLYSTQTEQQNNVNTIQQEVSSFNTEYKKYQDNVQLIKNELNEIDLKIRSYESDINSLQRLAELDVVPVKCYTENIKSEEEKVEKAEQEISKLNVKIENYTILVSKVFSKEGITSVVLDLITPYLNEHANYYLNKLSGSVLTIDMNTQKLNANNTLSDKFDLKVHNQAGADNYQNCSAGERKRIDIAIAFAIQDLQQQHNNTATNIAIYDECFDGLDSVGCESVIEILKEKAKTISSIFVITHNDTLKPLFDNAIKVVKNKQGISSIGA